MKKARKVIVIVLAVVAVAIVSLVAARKFVFAETYPAIGGGGGAATYITQ